MSTFYAPRACLSEGRAAYPFASAAAVPETLRKQWDALAFERGEKDVLGRNALFFDFILSSHRGCSRSAVDVEAKLNTSVSVIVLAAML